VEVIREKREDRRQKTEVRILKPGTPNSNPTAWPLLAHLLEAVPPKNGRTGNGEYEDDDEHEYDGCHLAEL